MSQFIHMKHETIKNSNDYIGFCPPLYKHVCLNSQKDLGNVEVIFFLVDWIWGARFCCQYLVIYNVVMLNELCWDDPWNIFNALIAISVKKPTKPCIGNDQSLSSLSRSRQRRKYTTAMPWLQVPEVSRGTFIRPEVLKLEWIVDFSRNKI